MLEHQMTALMNKGCYPCVSFRGRNKDGEPIWRAHVNGAGNHWAEASTPTNAMKEARKSWEGGGCPMDGYAAPPKGRTGE